MFKECSAEFCTKEILAKGLCRQHYARLRRTGDLYRRTIRDPNEFTIEKDYCLISLYDRKSNKVGEAVIDIEDMEKCKDHKWHLFGKENYVKSSKGPFLHNLILGRETNSDIVPDHKDANPLNNRKSNLQIITFHENIIKKSIQSNNSSGYRGVHKRGNYWTVGISLGKFETKEEAAQVYNEMALKLFGENATLNEIGG
jgi:hypothetical protein